MQNVVMMLGEHLRKAFRGLLLHGKGVRLDAILLANLDCFFHIFDAVAAFVAVVIARATIGDENHDFPGGAFVEQLILGIP